MTRTMPLEAGTFRGTTDELYAFRDTVSRLWLRFYTPARRFDLWQAYVAGARRVYRKFHVEKALALPRVTPTSTSPVFGVVTDDDGTVRAGWYINGPLAQLSDAYAPWELSGEPLSASLTTEWISRALPAGVIEVKAVWVDPAANAKPSLADLVSRSFVHAMFLLSVEHACCTAAEHASPRWSDSGARQLPGLVPAPYPDGRYRTTFLTWDLSSALELSSAEQRRLLVAERGRVRRQGVGREGSRNFQ